MTDTWLYFGAATVIVALAIMTILLKSFPGFFGLDPAKAGKDSAGQRSSVPGASFSGIIAPSRDSSAEIVAAIMAAITAARGPSAGAFRIASMTPSQTAEGFNTPAWGHIDRLVR